MQLSESPVQAICVDGRSLWVKRDDLLHPDFSGNKARKLYYLLHQDLSHVERFISYGSVQSNALYSLSVLAKLRGKAMDYYVTRIPAWLRQSPLGNYQGALDNGARFIEVGDRLQSSGQNLEQYVSESIVPQQGAALFVPEGGRFEQAREGVYRLADEIIQWQRLHAAGALIVMLPSGTGTTALFLNQRFKMLGVDIRVLTCACVGDADYLRGQFAQLGSSPAYYPEIISTGKKFHFGKLYPECYALWRQLRAQTDIEFDLLYDPQGWLALLTYLKLDCPDCQVMYLHQGGLLGNATMLPRYRRKYG